MFGNWGFVTLSSGNNAGVVQDSMLDVVRGGEVIAKLFVTAVESSSAAADLIPDSLAEDTVLMAGDKVVPSKKEAPADTKPATGGGGADLPDNTPPAPAPAPAPAPVEPPAEPADSGEPELPAAPTAEDPFQ